MNHTATSKTGIWAGLRQKDNIAIGILLVLHTVGTIGISSAYREWFQALTPINLLVSAGLLFMNHPDNSLKPFIAVATAFIVGYTVEVIGVHTGVIFGIYTYGATLGYKLFEVPLMIGVNWAILVYASGIVTANLKLPYLGKATLAAAIMVGLDYLIEPVAIQLDFWQWQNNAIPLRNYLGWFVTALALQLLFHRLVKPGTNNKVAPSLLLIQTTFFLILNWLL